MSHVERARKLRPIVEKAMQSVDGNEALTAISLYPQWAENVAYCTGHKVQRNGKLWRVVQAHTSQAGWEPENAASLWEQVNETHVGTIEDPIPYEGNMVLEAGKYYIQNGEVYHCIQDTGNPVHHALSDLVGLYVEIV